MNLKFFFDLLEKIWVLAEILLALITTTRRFQGKILDRGTQIGLWVVLVLASWMEGWVHRFFPPDMPGRHTWLLPVAFGILVLGLGIRSAAIVTLGGAFSANVALRIGQKLRRGGLYALVRHPSYLGMELILMALGLHARTWACVAVFFIPSTLAVLYRIHVEESALRLAFGADYEDYSRSTKRLIPGIY